MSTVSAGFPSSGIRSPRVWSRLGLAARKLPFPVFLLLTYVCAITLFGKGPTYIGVPPLFWGEVVMALSLLWAARNWHQVRFPNERARLIAALVVCFLILGAVEFFIQDAGISTDALRDSAGCYYSLFFFVGLALASNPVRMALFESRWRVFWILAIPWEALNAVTDRAVGRSGPVTPYGNPVFGGTGEVMLSLGLGTILLLTDRTPAIFRGKPAPVLLALGSVVFAMNGGRGVRLAIATAVGFAMLASLKQPGASRARRRLMILLFLGAASLLGAFVAGFDVAKLTYVNRFSEISEKGPEGTAMWRADWWAGLYDQVMERNPIFGLGFGDPLWEYNPQISEMDLAAHPVRSPHNYNVTVFARMGIAGSLFWGGILLLGVLMPAWEVVSASAPKQLARAHRQMFWVACLLGIWVNASFDVQMEGPVAGIPFWLILGIVTRGVSSTSGPTVRYVVPLANAVPALNAAEH